jgi:hypothetical protein
MVTSSIKQKTFAPTTFSPVGWYSIRKLLTVAPLTHGGKSKNCEIAVLNMTRIGKCHCKKLLEKQRF